MPHIFRKNTSGNWVEIKGIWRKFTVADAQGNFWRPVTFVWRRNTAGVWSQVYLQDDNLSQPTSGFTFTSSDASGDFFSGSTLTLTRGNWSNSPTEYRMRIQYGLSENDTVGTVAGPVTYTPANSTASTTLTYTLTAPDCLDPSYYYKGTINVDNAAGTNSRTATNQRRSKIKINFTFDSDLTPITSNGATARWTANVVGSLVGLSNDTFIDRINIIVINQSGTIVKRWQHRPNGGTIEAGYTAFSPAKPTSTTFTYTFSDPAITSSGGQHSVQVQVYARDTDKTLYFDTKTFTPLFPKPVNTVIPVINDTTPTVGDQLTTTDGSWTGQTPFTYFYQWQSSIDGNNWSNISGATNFVFYINPSSFLEGFRLRSRVIARDPQNQDSDPAFSLATSPIAQYVPNPVRNLAASGSGTTITVTWDKPLADPVWGSPSAYYVYLNGNFHGQDTSTSSSSETYLITGLSSGTYSVSVYAFYGDPFLTSALSEARTVNNIVLVAPPSRTATAFVYNGTFREGETVSVTAEGSTYWNGSPTTYTYEWGYFSSTIADDVIYGTGSSFTIPNNYADNNDNPSDLLRVNVIATNAGGSTSSYGAYQTVAQGLAPVNTVAPSATPTSAVLGTEFSTTNGTWSGNPTTYTYLWQTFSDGLWQSTGVTTQTYTPSSVGTYRCRVRATSVFGSNDAFSNNVSATAALFTVTFNANGGTGSPSVSSVTQSTSGGSVTLATQNTLARTGYTFRGWNTNSSGTGTTYTAGGSFTPTSNITLFALWQRSLSYDANGGSGAPSTTFHNDGTSTTVSTTTPTRSGFAFNGWNTASNGTGTSYASGASITMNSSITLFAQWTSSLFTVTFNANGGSGTVPAALTQSTSGGSITLPGPNTLTRTGFTFNGWNTNSSQTGTRYNQGDSFTPTSNTTLFANWSRTLSYDANGGSGAPSTTFHNNNSTATVSSTTPTRSGFTFNGWNTQLGGGGTSYSSGASITMSDNIILYAQWTATASPPPTPTISLACNNGSGSTISWNNVLGATTYELYQRTSSLQYTGNLTTHVGIPPSAGSTTSYNSPFSGNIYWSLRARNSNGASPWSAPVFAGNSCPI